MKRVLYFFLVCLILIACSRTKNQFETILPSPNSKIHIYFNLNDGEPYYLIYYKNSIIVDWSLLEFKFNDNFSTGNALELIEKKNSSRNIEMLDWKIFPAFSQNYNEVKFRLQGMGSEPREFFVTFRAFDSGVAFRYEFSENGFSNNSDLVDETQLDLIASGADWKISNNTNYSIDIKDTLNIPTYFILGDVLNVSIHEQNRTQASGRVLIRREPGKLEFKFGTIKQDSNFLIKTNTGAVTPWKIIQISKK